MKKRGGEEPLRKQVSHQGAGRGGGAAAASKVSSKRPDRGAGVGPSASSSKPTSSTPKTVRALASSGASSSSAGITTPTTWIQPPAALPSFRIIVGSYERLLYGLQVSHTNDSTPPTSTSTDSNLALSLSPIFQFPAHPSAIKALATAGSSSKFLVTAGQDELIKIWDLRRKREVGSLSGAELFGSPLSIDFPLPSHMLMTAEGGAILLYRTRDWALLHTFKGHTGRVNFISTHPSAKLALSGGQDGVLRAWDLTRGKSLGGTKMGMGHGGEMEALRWFGGEGKGHFFALLGRTVVRIFRKDMSEVARIGQGNLTGTRLNAVAVWDLGSLRGAEEMNAELKGKTLIFVAREDKRVGIYLFDRKIFDALDAKAKEKEEHDETEEEEEDDDDDDDDDDEEEEERTLKEIGWLEGHSSRVKGISLQPLSLPSTSSSPAPWVLTATTISSDGFVRIFNLASLVSSAGTVAPTAPAALEGEELPIIKPSAEYSTRGSRLTCLSVVGGDGALPSRSATATASGGDSSDEEEELEDADGEFFNPLSDMDTDLEGEGEGGEEDEEGELARLEEILREAKREGIDLEDLLKNGMGEEEEEEESGSGSEGEEMEELEEDEDGSDGEEA
ncbi:WD40 repeat-like protein [Microstroma glucosiphilum]|uniref:WD40 repeat-like protein n=1 Tax=Pseudomicrostroma glucosiphilum TaxID=1684307 RepID=A0A316U4Y3_9BASI|nr:WD40 repeat-like protein [Pseudomicrostroma glucosiphilum]PWN19393.1 WD40 repeat-like protein [Pseudomicrostroma glucosiphilum]